jgi:hypothetical protein
MEAGVAEGISLAEPHRAVSTLAELYCICEHRLEYGVQFAGRA